MTGFELKVDEFTDDMSNDYVAIRVTYAGIVILSRTFAVKSLPKRPT